MGAVKNRLKKIKTKKIWRKKSFWILLIVLIAVCGVGGFALRRKAMQNRLQDIESGSVKSAEVTKSTISNSIEGSGKLEAAESVDVMLPTGVTVDEVLVETGDEVSAGDALANLNKASIVKALVDVKDQIDDLEDDLDESGLTSLEKEDLNLEIDDLEEVESTLTGYYDDPVLKASADGIVNELYISDGSSVSDGDTSGNASSADLQSRTDEGGVARGDTSGTTDSGVSLASVSAGKSAAFTYLSADAGKGSYAVRKVSADNGADVDAQSGASTGNASDGEASGTEVIKSFTGFAVTAPVAGAAPQTKIESTDTYTGKISWDCSGSAFQAGTVYSATIVLSAGDGYKFSAKYLPSIDCASYDWNISGDGDTLTIQAKFEKTSEAQSDNSTQDAAAQETGDADDSASSNASAAKSGSGSTGGSGGSGSSGSASASSASTDAGADTGSDYESVALTIAKMENAKIAIDVDELDILSVEVGQSAVVTLDAIENGEFTGTISKVGATASTDSSSAKYQVDILIPMDENMRVGMNASATIQVEQAENVLTIPMSALQQKGERTFVYTTQGDDGTLGGETEVETGLSNSNEVEIVSGLSEGDTVYYTRIGSEDSDSDDFSGGFGGFGGEMPGGEGGGEMPDGGNRGGGEMPGGGNRGGSNGN